MIKITGDFDEESFFCYGEINIKGKGKVTVMEQRCIYKGKIMALDGKNTQEYTTEYQTAPFQGIPVLVIP